MLLTMSSSPLFFLTVAIAVAAAVVSSVECTRHDNSYKRCAVKPVIANVVVDDDDDGTAVVDVLLLELFLLLFEDLEFLFFLPSSRRMYSKS